MVLMGRLGQTDTVRGKIWLFGSRDEEKQACMFVLEPHLLYAWVFIDFYPAKKKPQTVSSTKLHSSSTFFFFFLHTIMGLHTSNGRKVTKISEDGFLSLSTGSSKGVGWNIKLSSRWSSWKWDLKYVFGNHEYDITSSQPPNISLFHPNIKGNDKMHKLLL